jgi:DNA-binding IclR family transcriptional regulator
MEFGKDGPAGREGRKPKEQVADGAEAKASIYSIAVLDRAIGILNVFSSGDPALGLKEIAAATQLPKPTVFRILSVLNDHDFIDVDPDTGRYSLGFALVRLADIRRRQANLHTVALPIMRQVRNALGETIVLSVRSGDSRVHIDSLEGTHAMRRMADLGVHAPLYAGASSKILLAGMDDEELEDYLARVERVQIQENTITKAEALRAEVALIRKRGYAESRGEFVTGGGAIAVPIKDYEGRTVAAIDVLTPQPRYTAEHRQKCIETMVSGGRQISERLGFRE